MTVKRLFPMRVSMTIALSAAGFFASAVCVHAQDPYIDSYSTIYIDPGSGEISADGHVEVGDDGGWNEYIIFLTATVEPQLSTGAVTSATDNCGAGCADSATTGQVTQLGSDYSVDSTASGEVDYNDADNAYLDDNSYASASVPPAPSINLQSIDATNPHQVVWAFSVSGASLYSQTFSLGGIVDISTTTTFTVDQSNYPSGSNTAAITGSMYGITVPGPVCNVNRADNVSKNNTYTGYVPDGTGFFIAPVHIAADVVTSIQYCVSPVAGSLLTRITGSSGSIDTSGADPGTNSHVDFINEQHNYNGNSDALGPERDPTLPAQGPNFMTRVTNYGDLWLPAVLNVSICNTALWLGDKDQDVFVTGSLGCIGLSLP